MKKREKYFAVIDKRIFENSKIILGKIFDPRLSAFSEAIYRFKDDARKYAKEVNKASGGKTKLIVVPCSITYTINNV